MGRNELTTFSGRRASQNALELDAFISLLLQRGVRSYLEIGARHGDTFHEIMISLPPGSRGVAVDLPGALWGTSSSQRSLGRAVTDLQRRGYSVSTLFGDSKTEATQRLVYMRGPYDAILIDGDHTYAGVLSDWEKYGLLAPIIAFHDIVGDGQRENVYGREVEVPRLWAEIKASLKREQYMEFIAPDSKMGIGVVLR